MQTSVKLQNLFSYSIYPIILLFIILIIVLGLYFYFYKKKKNKILLETVEIKKLNEKNIESIKNEYIEKINNKNKKIEKNEIDNRMAYQELSSIIRLFVYEVTNIKVQNYTLKDIKKLNMPILYELVKEYYVPEFSKNSIGDIKASLDKTKGVIKEWK